MTRIYLLTNSIPLSLLQQLGAGVVAICVVYLVVNNINMVTKKTYQVQNLQMHLAEHLPSSLFFAPVLSECECAAAIEIYKKKSLG
jgi:hypothetical protein